MIKSYLPESQSSPPPQHLQKKTSKKKYQLFYTQLQIQPVSYRSVQSTNKQLHAKSQSPPLYTFLFFWPRSYTAAAVRKPTKTVPLRVSSGHYHLCSLKMFCSECEDIEAKKNSACFRNFESWKDLGMYKQRNPTFESLLLERMAGLTLDVTNWSHFSTQLRSQQRSDSNSPSDEKKTLSNPFLLPPSSFLRQCVSIIQ